MSDLVVHATDSPAADGTFLGVTPASAGWTYVGFEVLALAPGVVAKRDTRDREVCIVIVAGTATVNSERGEFNELGGRPDPWSGPPDAAYLPPDTPFQLASSDHAEVALCWGPAPHGGAEARVLPRRGDRGGDPRATDRRSAPSTPSSWPIGRPTRCWCARC